MEETIQIKIKRTTWSELMKIKAEKINLKTFDEIIKFLLKKEK